jgi:predicted nucleotidyltransferase
MSGGAYMGELIELDRLKLSRFVREKLEMFPEVVGAYFFGSVLEKMRPDSDIDVGIILQTDAIKSEKELDLLLAKLANALGNYEGHIFDIVSIGNVNNILAFKILKKGEPIYIKDEGKVTDMIEIVSRLYSENYPRYKEALKIILEG